MDAILAPERDMKESLKVWGGGGCGFQSRHLHSAEHDSERNQMEVCFICVQPYVYALMRVCDALISVCVWGSLIYHCQEPLVLIVSVVGRDEQAHWH